MQKEIKQLKNPELISIEADGETNRHIPYGRINNELTYKSGREPVLKSLQNQGYVLKERAFSEIKKLTKNSEDYQKLDFPYREDDGVYMGAEHCDKNSSDEEITKKNCNLTFFGNLEAKLNGEPVVVMASSIGHFHPLKLNLQEIYEFQGYGLMVIEKKDKKKIDMIFMNPKGKVAVPGNCNMTIYNLDLKPLETHDFANPRQNESNKEEQEDKGPIFCIYYDLTKKRMCFDFNRAYSGTAFPGYFSIAIPIKDENNIGQELFLKSYEDNFKEKFGGIKVLNPYETEIPGISRSECLEKIVEYKPFEFCRLFNLPQNDN